MALPQSKVTDEGQVSVPEEIRSNLGIEPGTILEWEQDGDHVVVRKKGQFTFEDIHRALFGDHPPKPRTLEELKEGIADYIREKHARD
jgi:AbrB family looped-hinge helix DNA binding protein